MKHKDGLDIEKYPPVQRRFLKKELLLAKKFLENSGCVLDVGCGNGRVIPVIAPVVGRYTGIDIDSGYLRDARKYSRKYRNVRVLKLDAEKLSKKFRKGSFDRAVLLWNTVGCMKNDKKAIKEIAKVVRDGVFMTFIAKGTLEKRKLYYEKSGIKYTIDKKTETVYSSEWGRSRAYSKKEIRALVKGTGFGIDNIRLVGNLGYAVFLSKKAH